MIDNYTSLELSKKLAEAGCVKWSRFAWVKHETYEGSAIVFSKRLNNDDNEFLVTYEEDDPDFEQADVISLYGSNYSDFHNCITEVYNSYDILNDICCKYAKEVFGTEIYGSEEMCDEQPAYSCHAESVLYLMQEGKKEEAERYILDNCLFKNKANTRV